MSGPNVAELPSAPTISPCAMANCQMFADKPAMT